MLKKRAFKSLNLLILLVIVLVGVRLALPSWVKNYLNDQLAAMGEYQGHIADVDIALWRGAYVIHELNIVKTSEKVPVPFFEARSIDLSISWRALWAGQVVADVEFSKIRRKPSPVGRGYKAGREALYSIAVWLSIYVFNVSSVAPPAVQAK